MSHQLVIELGQTRLAVVVEHQHRVDHLVCRFVLALASQVNCELWCSQRRWSLDDDSSCLVGSSVCSRERKAPMTPSWRFHLLKLEPDLLLRQHNLIVLLLLLCLRADSRCLSIAHIQSIQSLSR